MLINNINTSFSYHTNSSLNHQNQANEQNTSDGENKKLENDKHNTKDETNKKLEKNDQNELSPSELELVKKLQARDLQVRTHEAAHLAVAGSLAIGGASFTYQKAPDGKQYAIGGEVRIDTSEEQKPQMTAKKMRQVKAAALAPSDPSAQDLQVAATASMLEMKALMQIAKEKSEQAKKQYTKNSTSHQFEISA